MAIGMLDIPQLKEQRELEHHFEKEGEEIRFALDGQVPGVQYHLIIQE